MSELAKNKERDITFDIMKGIGILLVLLGHVWGIPTVNHIITSFHMPMFFMVAGYFSKSYSPEISISTTVKHYAKRLIPPYLVTMLAIAVWAALKAYLNGGWDVVISKILSVLWADVSAVVLILLSLLLSMAIEWAKKVIGWNALVEKMLQLLRIKI